LVEADEFLEVYVETPIEVCRSRDPKGLYKKADGGLIPNFTGVGQDYEVPSNPELILDGTKPPTDLADQIQKKMGEMT
jgi:bifunctional enzyme CysN/CysC